jgi:hypothetical protein
MLGRLESDGSNFEEAKKSDGFAKPFLGDTSGAFEELSCRMARDREHFPLEPVQEDNRRMILRAFVSPEIDQESRIKTDHDSPKFLISDFALPVSA